MLPRNVFELAFLFINNSKWYEKRIDQIFVDNL